LEAREKEKKKEEVATMAHSYLGLLVDGSGRGKARRVRSGPCAFEWEGASRKEKKEGKRGNWTV